MPWARLSTPAGMRSGLLLCWASPERHFQQLVPPLAQGHERGAWRIRFTTLWSAGDGPTRGLSVGSSTILLRTAASTDPVGRLDGPTRRAILADLSTAFRPYLTDDAMVLPVGIHIVMSQK